MHNPDGRLTIDLGALRANYAQLCAMTGKGCTVAAALKANAYGLGAVEVAGALLKAGCRDFFVAHLDEALDLRAHYKDCNIYVLNGFYASRGDLYLTNNLIPVLGSFMEIEAYKKLGANLPAFLNFNTRMNRLGLGTAEQEDLWKNPEKLSGIAIKGVMSHLACADEPDHEMNKIQLELFQDIAGHFPEAVKSLANSSGIFLGKDYHFDLARPGAALYGINPTPGKPNPMKPVVSLEVPIMRVRLVYKGATAGYGATYHFERDSQIATVSAGYADGIFRYLSNKGAFYWHGMRCPIRGRVSMDLTTVDLSDVPENNRPRPGDVMEILGPHQSADDLARDAETIGYEVLTNLGNRYKRQYVH